MQTGTKVKIKCDAYKNGRTFTGTVKSVKKELPNGTQTLNVLIDGNLKTTSFCSIWLTKI